MSDSYRTVIQKIIVSVKGNAALNTAIGGRVYTNVPQNETFPYVVVGIDSSDFSTKDTAGMEHVIQFDIYSRTATTDQVSNIRKMIYDLFNRDESKSDTDIIDYQTGALFKEPDGVTWHGVIQFRAINH